MMGQLLTRVELIPGNNMSKKNGILAFSSAARLRPPIAIALRSSLAHNPARAHVWAVPLFQPARTAAAHPCEVADRIIAVDSAGVRIWPFDSWPTGAALLLNPFELVARLAMKHAGGLLDCSNDWHGCHMTHRLATLSRIAVDWDT